MISGIVTRQQMEDTGRNHRHHNQTHPCAGDRVFIPESLPDSSLGQAPSDQEHGKGGGYSSETTHHGAQGLRNRNLCDENEESGDQSQVAAAEKSLPLTQLTSVYQILLLNTILRR